jgi:hypothetical protein
VVDGVDAADDGAASSSTGQSAPSDPAAGGAVFAGSGDAVGAATSGGEGAGEATFGFSLIHPPEVSANKTATMRGPQTFTHPASDPHDRPQIRDGRSRASVPPKACRALGRAALRDGVQARGLTELGPDRARSAGSRPGRAARWTALGGDVPAGGDDTDRSCQRRNQGHRGPHHFIVDVVDMVLGLQGLGQRPQLAKSSGPDAVP